MGAWKSKEIEESESDRENTPEACDKIIVRNCKEIEESESNREETATPARKSNLEKAIDGSASAIAVKTLVEASKAVCKIIIRTPGVGTKDYNATGFLAKFITGCAFEVRGLFTNNHVLDIPELIYNSAYTIDLVFEGVGRPTPLFKTLRINGLFRFTCSVLDVTFVQFDQATIDEFPDCYYTQIGDHSLKIKKELFVLQHPNGNNLQYQQGAFLKYHGVDFFHSITTDQGSSGSPIALHDGTVVGIHKAYGDGNHNIAVRMTAVMQALIPFFSNPNNIPHYLVCNELDFNQQYYDLLSDIGLTCITSGRTSKKFQSLGTAHKEPLWFVATSHGWFWTPTDPGINTLEMNWMPVSQLNIVGGPRDGEEPADTFQIIWLLKNNIVRGVPCVEAL